MSISITRKFSMVVSKLTLGLLGKALSPQDYMTEARRQLDRDKNSLRSNLVKVVAATEKLTRKKNELSTQINATEQSIKQLLTSGDDKSLRRAEQEAARIVALRAAVTQVDTALQTQATNADRTRNLIHVLETKAIELETQIGNLETAEMVAQVTGSSTSVNWDKNSYRKFMDEAARIVNEKYDTSQAQAKVSSMLGEESLEQPATTSAVASEIERIRKSMA